MKHEVTDDDRDKAGQIVEATWADFMRDQNTPFYRPAPELRAAMACMVISGIVWGRYLEGKQASAAIEEEREACAKIAEHPIMDWNSAGKFLRDKWASEIAKMIRARGERNNDA
ncbi:MAG TPA: hypothetical protein VFO63_09695 [Blastocatellia bacterium]|nr:hypothetical protein [Blastocatellia bacterium]